MPTPTNRTPLRVARGTYSNLNGSVTDLQEGEIAFATDEGKLYVKQGAGLTSISASSQAAPTPSDVTASPAFVSGAGTQADPFVITNGASPFAGGTLNSAQQITIANGTPGDLVIFTDNSTVVSDRFKGQEVGTIDGAGNYTFKLNYTDTPNTTTNNTTYVGSLQVGSVHFQWTVVQSDLTQLTQATATSISGSVGVGNVLTATEGTATGGTASISYATRWQRSFTGSDGWFNIGGATGTTYTLSNGDAGYYVRAVTTATDSTPSGQGGPLTLEIESSSSNNIPQGAAPVINNVVLSEDNASGARFTGKAFNSVVTMGNNGTPVSQKSVKGKVTASFQSFPSTTAITANNVNTSTTSVGSMSAALNSLYYQFSAFTLVDPGTGKLRAFGIQWDGGSNNDDLYESTNDFESWNIVTSNYSGYESSGHFHANVNRAGTYVNFWGQSNTPLTAIKPASILSGVPYKEQAMFCSTNLYHYRLGYSGSTPRLYKELRDGTQEYYGGSGNTSQGYKNISGYYGSGNDTGMMMIETAPDRIVLIGKSNYNSGNDLYYKEFTDAESTASGSGNGGSLSYDFRIANFKRTEMGAALYHKNAVFLTYRNSIMKINNDASSASAVTSLPLPTGSGFSNTGYTTLWESPDGLLIAKQTVYNNSNSYAWSYYYSSNNSGATWVANYYPTISNQAYERYTPDIYAYGHRAQMYVQKNSYYASYKIQAYRLGYQDLTVTDGADLSSLNVNDVVKFSASATPDQHAKIMTITANGNGTTTIRVRSFATASVGDTIQAIASTGSATATRFLVISTSGAVTSTQSADPGFVELGPGLSQTLTFPATFPTGSAPDTELPTGTTMQVDVKATNTAASDTFSSNIITPS